MSTLHLKVVVSTTDLSVPRFKNSVLLVGVWVCVRICLYRTCVCSRNTNMFYFV